MSDVVIWSPRVGDTGDDRYAASDTRPTAGSSAFADPDLPTLGEVNGSAGINQIRAEVHRRYFLNSNTKLTAASLPYVTAGAKCPATDVAPPRTHINNTIRYFENRGYFNFTTNPVSGDRMNGADVFDPRKALAYEALTGQFFLCRGPNNLLNNTKFHLCSKADEANSPVTWRGAPLLFQSAWLRPTFGIFNGMVFGPQARFDTVSCESASAYMPDGTGTPQARITFVRQVGTRLIARGQTKIGASFGGQIIYSDDWGLTWTRCTFPNFSQNGFTWNFITITSQNILQMASGRLMVAGTTNRADDPSFERGDAIWYSDDNGASWTGRLIFSHRDSAFVYAGIPCNLFEYGGKAYVFTVNNQWTAPYYRHESSDGGQNWGNRVGFNPDALGVYTRVWTFSSGAVVVHINTDTFDTVSKVVGVAWRSVDLGLNWTNIQAQYNLQGLCKIGDDLYALIPNASSGFFDFCHSIDAGGSFNVVCQTDVPIDSFRGFPSGTETTYCNNLLGPGNDP